MNPVLQDTPADVERLETLEGRAACPRFVERVPIDFARRMGLIGLDAEHGRLPVAVAGELDWERLDVVARYLGRPVTPLLAPADAVLVYRPENIGWA